MRFSLTHLVIFAALMAAGSATVVASCQTAKGKHSVFQSARTQPDYAPDEMLVGFDSDASAERVTDQLLELGIVKIETRIPQINVVLYRLLPGTTLASAMKMLTGVPGIDFSEPNYFRSTCGGPPNDTYWGQQYAPKKVQVDLAWPLSQPKRSCVIAIVDTGVDSTHPDLVDKILRDSSGRVVSYNALTKKSAALDDYGHGTHVAGIAAAEVNDGKGVAGIAGWPQGRNQDTFTKILPIKVLDKNGDGGAAWIADGITQAAELGANVINLSLGGAEMSNAEQRAITYACTDHQCVVVCAAGNNSSSSRFYPAACDHCISVGATDSNDKLAALSDYGAWVMTVAPGVDIISTFPTYHVTMNDQGARRSYEFMSGTSMASPLVAGEAALLLEQSPGLSNPQVMALITHSANTDKYTPYSGRKISSTGGRVNIYRSLKAATP